MAKYVPTDARREQACARVAREAASQGIILLKNDGQVLPLGQNGKEKVAVFGIGQIHTVKGGTGSGDVNNRYTVNILDGLMENPKLAVDRALADRYKEYTQTHPSVAKASFLTILAYCNPEMEVDPAEYAENTTAIYVLSRIAGEGGDMADEEGQFRPSAQELALLGQIRESFKRVVVILNVPGVIEARELDRLADAVVFFGLGGQEGGNALADVLTGEVNPSGKTVDTWAYRYSDYSTAKNFGTAKHNGVMNPQFFGMGESEQCYINYEESIYVGYRYFDTFGKDVLYPFGFGLSYTDFEVTGSAISVKDGVMTVSAGVMNTGKTYAGREVMQVYVSAPEGKLAKPYQELKGFKKTGILAPGEEAAVQIEIPIASLASYSEEKAAYVLEKGAYYVRLGNSSRSTKIIGALSVEEEIVTKQLKNLTVRLGDDFTVLQADTATPIQMPEEEAEKAEALSSAIPVDGSGLPTETVVYGKPASEKELTAGRNGWKLQDVGEGRCTLEEFVAQLSEEELIHLVCGVGMDLSGLAMDEDDETKKQQEEAGADSAASGMIGSVSLSVAGAAGESYDYTEEYGIKPLVLCDGPAGVRITREVTNEDGEVYEQNCTAYPVGTVLASAWDPEVIRQVGHQVGQEMLAYDVDLWLAPGMNIHRNPLCGRNFEYYSEDPLIAGTSASAMAKSVQENGVGVTIKHFAANNQENERTNSNSVIDERALREIYLKGFEIAVTTGDPWAIMTSYNDINGVPSADNYELLHQVAREEWHFNGFVMTDWGGGASSPGISMYAGNDMIQPGGELSRAQLREQLAAGHAVSRGQAHVDCPVTKAMLQNAVLHILKVHLRCPASTGKKYM